MATVPRYDGMQVQANTLPQTQVSAPAYQDFAAQQGKEFGAAVQGAGEMGGRIATDAADRANQIRLGEALNQVKEEQLRLTFDKDTGFSNVKGRAAVYRDSGKPLADEYSEKLQDHVTKIGESLGNDAQRIAFNQHAAGMVTAFKGNALSHEANEAKSYGLSTQAGIMQTAVQDIELNWRDPQAVENAVTRIQASTYQAGQLAGTSASEIEANARKAMSHGHKVAMLSALESNEPAFASQYLDKVSKGGQITGEDAFAVRGHITQALALQTGTTVATDTLRKLAPHIQTSEAERAFNIAVGTESNGQQFDKNGAPLTSSKGAIGIAQVMPGTAPEAAKLAGLPWDENRYKTDANYNKALGMAYFQKQLLDNSGDLAKTYAAYNAGPGRLQEAIKKAEKNNQLAQNDPTIGMKTWYDFVPPETKAYVTKNMKEFETGQGKLARPTFQEIDEGMRSDPRLANNPLAYKVAREEASRQFEQQTKAIQQKEDEAVAGAIRSGAQVGYRFSALPASVRAAIPAEKLDDVRNTLASMAKGDSIDNPVAYQKVVSNPSFMARMSEDQWLAYSVQNFTQETKKHLDTERAKLTGATPSSNGPGELNSQAIKNTLDSRLRMMGVDPTPKDDGGSNAARLGATRSFVDQYFMSAQREAGKKFTDTEVAAHIDALFAKNVTFRGWFSNSSGPMLGMTAGQMPQKDLDNIKAKFEELGNSSPTEAQIMNAYWLRKVARK